MVSETPTQLLQSYLNNIRTLLQRDAQFFGRMVDRQIVMQLLPKINGSRPQLEYLLWELLWLCRFGHDITPLPCTEEHWQEMVSAMQAPKETTPSCFPHAAHQLFLTLVSLREYGFLPKPKHSS